MQRKRTNMMSFEQYIEFKKSQFQNKLYSLQNNTHDMFLYMQNKTDTTTSEMFETLLNAKRLFDKNRNEVYNNQLFDTFTTRFVCQFEHNIDSSNVFQETDSDNVVQLNISRSNHQHTSSGNKRSKFISKYHPETSVLKTSFDRSTSSHTKKKESIRLNPNWSDSKKQQFNKQHPYFVSWTEDEKRTYKKDHPEAIV